MNTLFSVSPDQLSTIQEKTAFLIAAWQKFGLPYWERLSEADRIVGEESVPVGGAVRYAYASADGRIRVEGSVDRIKMPGDVDGDIPFRIFFSYVKRNGTRMRSSRTLFPAADLQRLYIRRNMDEESYPAGMIRWMRDLLHSHAS